MGTYQTGRGLTNLSGCVLCDPGTYQSNLGQVAPGNCSLCGPGTYVTGEGMIASANCSLCSGGTYQTGRGMGNEDNCTSCPAGTYQTGLGQIALSSCVLCGVGKYQTGTGLVTEASCGLCGQGKYQTGVGLVSENNCSLCWSGKYQTGSGMTTAANCSLCGAGTYQTGSGMADETNCSLCGPGKYQTGLSLISELNCSFCDPGTFSTGYGETNLSGCELCRPGTYLSGWDFVAPSNCSLCGAGKYQTGFGMTMSSDCIFCEKGKFQTGLAMKGENNCSLCSPGMYQTGSGMLNCTFCETGTYQTGLAMTKCQQCIAGTFQTGIGGTNSAACLWCQSGLYQQETGQSFCIQCGKGKYSTASGANSPNTCALCKSGTFNPTLGAPSSAFCTSCSPGTYADVSAGFCISTQQRLDAVIGFAMHESDFLQTQQKAMALIAIFFGVDVTQVQVYSIVNSPNEGVQVTFYISAAPSTANPSLSVLNAILQQGGFALALDVSVTMVPMDSVILSSCELATNTTPATCSVDPLLTEPLTRPSTPTLYPYDVLLVPNLNMLYYSVPDASALFSYSLTSQQVLTLYSGVGDGQVFLSPLHAPTGLALSPSGASGFVADTLNHCLHSFSLPFTSPSLLSIGECGWPPPEGANSSQLFFLRPISVSSISYGSELLILDSNSIYRVNVSAKTIRAVAGAEAAGFAEGSGSHALFNQPLALAASALLPVAFVADTGNYAVRRVDLSTGAVTLLAGYPWAQGVVDGVGSAARFIRPCGIALTRDNQWLYVTDSVAQTLRAISVATGAVSTLVHTPPAPCGVAIAPLGIAAYVAHAEGVDMVSLLCNIPGMVKSGTGSCVHS